MDDLIALLKDGKVAEFNEKRSRRGTLELFAADLAAAEIPEVDLSGTNLQKADLTEADLTDAVLARTDLSGADISGTKLSGVMAVKSRWKETFIEDSDLSMSDLSGADFGSAELTRTKLSNATMAGARLTHVVMEDCQLDEVDLTEARLTGARLVNVDLSNAVLREANLKELVTERLVLVGADLTRASLSNADLKGADLTGAQFGGADLSNADLSGATLTNADFTKADLTGAKLEGCVLEGAIFLDAETDPEVTLPGQFPEPPAIDPLVVAEPSVAVGPDAAMVVWESTDAAERMWLHLAAAPLTEKPKGKPSTLPLPAELVLARCVAARGRGFVVLALVERPGGVVASSIEVSDRGVIGTRKSFRLPYTPSVKPLLLSRPEGPTLFGISREGPGLHVHRLTEDGLESVHVSKMATARGFASDHDPVVLSKGSVLVRLEDRGAGQPHSAPTSFPGRTFGAAAYGSGMVLAWVPKGTKGLRTIFLEQGQPQEEQLLMPKELIGNLDLGVAGEDVWVVFTRESPGSGATSAWAMRLPSGESFPIVDDEEEEVAEVRIHTEGGSPLAVITYEDGRLELFEITGRKVRRRWKLG